MQMFSAEAVCLDAICFSLCPNFTSSAAQDGKTDMFRPRPKLTLRPACSRKRKFMTSRIRFYASQGLCQTFQLPRDLTTMYLLCSGDIEANPGPTKNPCSVCTKPVAINHRAVHCNTCEKDCHIGKKCGNVNLKEYKEMKSNGFVSTWLCPQ